MMRWWFVLWLALAGLTAQAETRPNIVVVLVDDAALMDFGVFGGEASTPNIDALAQRGAIFRQHRATPFCAPSRAMLLTGMDNHLAGLGTIREVLPPEHRGQPGYTMALEPGVETIATKLKRAGYRTYMTGKWHLGHGEGELPIDHGFDRSFILDASGADHWEDKPYLPYYKDAPWFEDDKEADLPEDFYSSTFIADQMQVYLDAHADREEPFFAYVAFLAVHIPVQAPREYTEKYIETYAEGWNAIRTQRWQRAQDLGLVRQGAPLAPQPESIPRWEDLTPDEQRLAAKSMAVNAGALEAMDAELGGLIDYLKSTDDYENTVFVVTSDNGPEAGDPWGAAIGWWMGLHDYSRSYDNLGEKGSYVAIGPGGASANAGPSLLFKFHTGEGGLRVPMLMAGPGIEAGAEVESFTVMSDIAPTLLDLARAREPSSSAVSMTGRSLVPVLAGQSDRTYFDGDAIGIETSGQAALYKGRYKLVRSLPPHGDSTWRLFDILDDPGETTDLAARIPGVMENLTHEYRLYANRVGVLELPEGYQVERAIARNMLGKLWQHYWGWIIIGAAVLLAGIGGVGLAGRALWRRLG
ncbi:MAG: sulfatase-like hydrolase/transferase [Henriciella sp.]|nr:sulfatase-like hydrolase/transferase [Henriciella sp.]